MSLLRHFYRLLFPPEKPKMILGEQAGKQKLEQFIDQVQNGAGYPGVMIVTGCYGMGKSHWLRYLYHRCRADNFTKSHPGRLPVYLQYCGDPEFDLRHVYSELFNETYGLPKVKLWQNPGDWFQPPSWPDNDPSFPLIFTTAKLGNSQRFDILRGKPPTMAPTKIMQEAGIAREYIVQEKFPAEASIDFLLHWLTAHPCVRRPLLLIVDELDRLSPEGLKKFTAWLKRLSSSFSQDLVFVLSITHRATSLKKHTNGTIISLKGVCSLDDLRALHTRLQSEERELKVDEHYLDWDKLWQIVDAKLKGKGHTLSWSEAKKLLCRLYQQVQVNAATLTEEQLANLVKEQNLGYPWSDEVYRRIEQIDQNIAFPIDIQQQLERITKRKPQIGRTLNRALDLFVLGYQVRSFDTLTHALRQSIYYKLTNNAPMTSDLGPVVQKALDDREINSVAARLFLTDFIAGEKLAPLTQNDLKPIGELAISIGIKVIGDLLEVSSNG